jgi:DNA-binding CsgD family transcriptional regulator
MAFQEFIAQNTGPIGKEVLFQNLGTFLGRYGIEFYGYQIMATHLRRLNWQDGFVFNNLTPEFLALVRARGYDSHAIIASSVAHREEPYFWSQVRSFVQLTPQQIEYLGFLKSYGFRDGITVPIFGANGSVALVAGCSVTQDLRIGPDDLLDLQLVSAFVHKRYLQMFGASDVELPRLTKREREVLGWMAQGKSTGVIASIMGVSEHTVDTLTRRTFQKLGVNDRISAVLKAVGAGLVAI